jgi:hypothetical protein
MRRRFARALLIAGVAIGATMGAPIVPLVAASPAAVAHPLPVAVRVGPVARRIPQSYVGFSAEWPELAAYEARGPALARLLGLLSVAREPVSLRIGGETADSTYWPAAGSQVPSKAYVVGGDYFATLAQLARATPLRLMVDLNLVAQSPQMAQTVARALRRWLPPSSVAGFEIGNEPDLYHAGLVGTMNISPGDGSPFDWALEYSASAYAGDFARYVRALRSIWPNVRYAGPAQCSGQTDYVLDTLRTRAMSMLTLHRYQFNTRGGIFSPNYPTQAKYLSAADARGFAAKNRWFVGIARQAGIPVKVTEFNDAVGEAPGLTNSYVTALWGANTLFDLLAEGTDGVSVHLRLKYLNSPVTAEPSGGLRANPLYYGMLLVTRTLGPGSSLMRVATTGAPHDLTVWAVRDDRGTTRVLVVNGTASDVVASNRLGPGADGTVVRLTAPSPSATTGVRFAGRSLNSDGVWTGAYRSERVRGSGGVYPVRVPRYSAALLTVTR